MRKLTKERERRFLKRAEALEDKAIALFTAIERAYGEDSDEASYASGAMTSCVELVSALAGRAALQHQGEGDA